MHDKRVVAWIAAERAAGRDPLAEALGRVAVFELAGSSDGAAAWREIAERARREATAAEAGASGD